MNESGVSSKLRTTLVESGALCWKLSDRFHASRPDLFLLYKGQAGFLEMKVYPGKPTELQTFTLLDIAKHNGHVWLGTYHKSTKHFEVTDIATGVVTHHSDHRKLASWLLNELCSSTKLS